MSIVLKNQGLSSQALNDSIKAQYPGYDIVSWQADGTIVLEAVMPTAEELLALKNALVKKGVVSTADIAAQISQTQVVQE